MTDPMIHIYPSEMHHAEATILGNRAGLQALRDLIDAALREASPNDLAHSFLPADGEGYSIIVRCVQKQVLMATPVEYGAFPADWTDEDKTAFQAAVSGRYFEPAEIERVAP